MTPLILTVTIAVLASNVPQAPEPAAPAPVATAAKVQPAKADGSRVECRDEPITGSRFTRHVCATQAQWARYHEQAERFMSYLIDRTNSGADAKAFF
jgi:hypothetical protein